MNTQLSQVMLGAEGRYLSSAEIDNVMELMRSYEARMRVMQTVEEREDYIVRETVERVFEKFPQFPAERPQAFDKCVRDVSLVLRYAVTAYVNSDPLIFEEKILYWMKGVIQSMGFVDVAKVTYSILQNYVLEVVPETEAAEINKYLQMLVEIMDE